MRVGSGLHRNRQVKQATGGEYNRKNIVIHTTVKVVFLHSSSFFAISLLHLHVQCSTPYQRSKRACHFIEKKISFLTKMTVVTLFSLYVSLLYMHVFYSDDFCDWRPSETKLISS